MPESLRNIKANPKNPRRITGDRYSKLHEYMQEFGDLSGLVVNSDGTIISGHQRTRVFKKEKGKLTVLERYDPPAADGTTARGFVELKDGSRFVYREVDWPQEKADRATIVANGQFGEWDADILTNEWEIDIPELREFGVPEFVFGGAEANGGAPVEAQEDGYEIPEEIKTDIVLGDLFEIGPHRLLCGDSTVEADVARLMDGAKADMVFTDPPYGMDFKGDVFGKDGIRNDKANEWEGVLKGAVSNIISFCENAVCAVCFSPSKLDRFFECVKGLKFKRILVIYKPNRMGYPWQGWILTSEIVAIFEHGSPSYIKENHKHDVYVFDYSERPDRDIDHPNVKPLSIVFDIIGKTKGASVLDLFLGSGTTMVAAHQLNRKCYGMEIDPKYCQVIINRMLKLDPALEIKRNGKPYQKTGE